MSALFRRAVEEGGPESDHCLFIVKSNIALLLLIRDHRPGLADLCSLSGRSAFELIPFLDFFHSQGLLMLQQRDGQLCYVMQQTLTDLVDDCCAAVVDWS